MIDFGALALRLPPASRTTWARELDAASRNTAWAGGRLFLFWPADDTLSVGFWVPAGSTWRPPQRIARELEAEVLTEHWISAPELDPPHGDASPGAWRDFNNLARSYFTEIHDALPWPGRRCRG